MRQSVGFVKTLHPRSGVVPLGRFFAHDLDVLRLLLHGSSTVDWFRLHFRDREEVDAFLRVNEFEPEDKEDQRRLLQLLDESVEYLEDHLRYRIPDEVKKTKDVRTLFDLASADKRKSLRMYACMTLKVMHITHYVAARELLSVLPISETELVVLMRAKIERVVRGLVERNFSIVEFSGNSKAHYSLISKLLAKRSTQRAQIFDKLRFRIIVERMEDIPAALLALLQELVPFNYAVPEQSENSLLNLDRLLVRAGNLVAVRDAQQQKHDLNENVAEVVCQRKNEFSGPDYSVINFVADIPLRLDRVLSFSSARLRELGSVVFVTVEFQIVDQVTAASNEKGQNRHSLYKERQRKRVKERLQRGRSPAE